MAGAEWLAFAVTIWATWLYASWRLAALEPSEFGQPRRRGVRMALRISSIASVVLLVASTFAYGVRARGLEGKSWYWAFLLSMLITTFTYFWRVHHIALRLGKRELAGQAAILAVLARR